MSFQASFTLRLRPPGFHLWIIAAGSTELGSVQNPYDCALGRRPESGAVEGGHIVNYVFAVSQSYFIFLINLYSHSSKCWFIIISGILQTSIIFSLKLALS